ncbi:X2-like carbohydrate binding domain-containing protein [Micromonospora chokoriensis]|uniref:X2-like carbohydrate binding domain-containing protein n=1 Tax=Micromonospora chokoriensis TaxID=356851 RepID=UPI0004C3D839|nr:X2-like carbohydrate binding domain-containing protein [Micromonospora chokoriensis]
MTRKVHKAMRGAVVGLTVAALLPVGLTASAASAGPATAARLPAPTTAANAPYAPAGERARKPYMGWSSYSMQVFVPNGSTWITAAQLKAQSDAMHEKLQAYGYEYINVDAGWNSGVDEYGRPVPSKTLYPDGLQNVIDHVHANGQKFGLYGIPGISSALIDANLPIYGAPGCTTGNLPVRPLQQGDHWKIGHKIDFKNPCAQAYVNSIADLYASWGVDFLKFDSVTPGSGINDLSVDSRDDVKAWSQALARHGIWFELSWALDIRYADYWKQYANGWRIDWDVECYCTGEALTAWSSISRLFPKLAEWWRHGGPGGWNDLDSLNVGNGQMDGLTRDERRTAATLWAVSAAPLYIGNDMTRLDSYGLDLLTNREVIAVNQAGRPAQPLSIKSNRQTWFSLNEDNSYTVALFNLGSTEANMAVNWADLGLNGSAKVRDLWAKKDLGEFASGYVANDVPVHGVRLLKVTPQKNSTVSVNDDDLRVSYEGAWQRNGNREVAAVAEQLTVDVRDSSASGAKAAKKQAEAGVRTISVNNDNPEIVYTGSWGRSTNRGLGDFQDDVHYAEPNGDAFQYSFIGTGVDYVTELHESQGDVDIYIDGEFKKTVSTHLDPAAGRKAQQVVYSISDLPNGTHTIRGVKRSGSYMLLDKFDVRQESLLSANTATFDKKASAQADVTVEIGRDPGELAAIAHGGKALVKGTDYTINGQVVTIGKAYLAAQPVGNAVFDFRFRGDHRDDVHSATENGAAVAFTFRGVGVEWRTALGPDQGEADVFIDGKLVKRVSLSNPVRVTGRPAFVATGLKDAEHTLRIVKVSGDVLRNDVIQYTILKRP